MPVREREEQAPMIAATSAGVSTSAGSVSSKKGDGRPAGVPSHGAARFRSVMSLPGDLVVLMYGSTIVPSGNPAAWGDTRKSATKYAGYSLLCGRHAGPFTTLGGY